MSFAPSTLARFRVETSSGISTRPTHFNVKCQASKDERTTRRQLLSIGLFFTATVISPSTRADIIEDLKAKTEANKSLNDRKRLATSGANFARSRTVQDGTCQFPSNFFGCDIESVAGKVKYISDDIALECSGNEAGYCTEVPDMIHVGSR